MSVRETALKAHLEREGERRRDRTVLATEERERERSRYQRGAATLAASPLSEWFPGESWDIMDFASRGAAAGYGDGRNVVVSPSDRSVWLLLQIDRPPRDEDTVHVYFVELARDTDTGYSYYTGPEVKSAADVGAQLARKMKQ